MVVELLFVVSPTCIAQFPECQNWPVIVSAAEFLGAGDAFGRYQEV